MVLAMAMPAMALAQQGPYNDKQNPNEYTDTEDGQLLKVVSYFIAPIGYALEWGVTRPLHYLATKTSLAPVMSGDTEYSQLYNPGGDQGQPDRARATSQHGLSGRERCAANLHRAHAGRPGRGAATACAADLASRAAGVALIFRSPRIANGRGWKPPRSFFSQFHYTFTPTRGAVMC